MDDILEIRTGNTSVEIIFGQAGSGKSTKLIDMIKSGEIENPIILCSKWMLVRTMKDKLKEKGITNCRVNTLQSITNNVDNAPSILAGVKTIVIDEFSQVNYNQLLLLVDSAEKLGIVNMFTAGDFLQNEPIEGGSYSPIRQIIRQYLLGKTSNFFASLVRQPIYKMMKDENIDSIEVPKALKTIFKEIKIDILMDNWRQDGTTIIRGYDDILILLNNHVLDSYEKEKNIKQLEKGITDKNWQLIVADWQQMSIINSYAIENNLDVDIDQESQLYVDVRGFEDTNYRKYYKKIDGKFKMINGRDGVLINDNSILHIHPTYAIVADSAQGMEFENVILFSMLNETTKYGTKYKSWSNFSFNTFYMAATRHIKKVEFCFDFNGWKDMRNAIDILPHARKDMLKEEWLEYCLAKAPNPEIGFHEYSRRAHFLKDEKTGNIYSKIGNNIILEQNGMEIRFSQNAKKDIELFSEIEFMRRWLKVRGKNEYASDIITKVFGSAGSKKIKPSKAEKFIIDNGIDNIDFTLSVRKFKAEYDINKRHVEAAIETYQNWI